MSHNVLISNVKITNLDALRRAIQELSAEGINVAFLEQKTFRTYRGQSNKCDFCVSLPDQSYDVGFQLQRDGSYIPICDASMMPKDGSSISCAWRQGDSHQDWNRIAIGKLVQRYTTCVTEDTFAMQGFPTTRELDMNTGDVFVIAETF
jgi:hypothetical protein